MPPPGGTSKVVGNQAFALACPAGRHSPLLFDSALSAISWTQIEELRDRGEPLPAGVALDTSGEPTSDHGAALAGMLLPVGGHRGFGIALMWEVLTGVLSGNDRFATAITPLAELDRPQSVAHFYLAIDPTVAMPYAEFTARVDALIDQMHASPPAKGVDRVFVPGEQGFATAARRAREGIPISAERDALSRALGESVGVPW
jgi:LDH2 family malate/lactate/ureidoglycolate dehydrogenase